MTRCCTGIPTRWLSTPPPDRRDRLRHQFRGGDDIARGELRRTADGVRSRRCRERASLLPLREKVARAGAIAEREPDEGSVRRWIIGPLTRRARFASGRAPSPARGEGKRVCRSRVQNPDSVFTQPPSFSRRVFARVISADAPSKKVRGRAGRRGSSGPTGSGISRRRSGTAVSAEPPLVVSKPQVRLLSSVPRAVFEACSARPPVG